MKLNMKTWGWVEAFYNDERQVKPKTPGQFTLTFGDEGRFTAATDCNTMAGSYVADTGPTGSGTIVFSDIISTKKFCEGSQETEFARLLTDSSHYSFTPAGELVLDLKFDSGEVVFK